MTQTIRKDTPTGPRQNRRTAAPEQAAKGKKPYRKPELSRYEQLHGIGIGS
jgi:hypothetical protein